MHLVGKRPSRSLVAAATGHNHGLLFLCDSVSKRQFLIDTGAEVSVLPATGLDTRTRKPGPPLLAANGSTIRTYGTRQLSYISEFTTDIQHVPGKDNSVADTLSRATIADGHLGIDYGGMATAQQQDSEVQAYRTATSSLQVEDIPFGEGIALLCDTSTGRARPIVPDSWRRQVFDLVHGLSHPSVRTTRKLVANIYMEWFAKAGWNLGQAVHCLPVFQGPSTHQGSSGEDQCST